MSKVQISFQISEEKEHDMRATLRMAGAELITVRMLATQEPETKLKSFQEMRPPVTVAAQEIVSGYQAPKMSAKQQSRENKTRTILMSPGMREVFKLLVTKKFGTEEELRKVFTAVKSHKNQVYSPTTFYSYLRDAAAEGYIKRTASGNYEINREKFETFRKEQEGL